MAPNIIKTIALLLTWPALWATVLVPHLHLGPVEANIIAVLSGFVWGYGVIALACDRGWLDGWLL